MDKLKTVCIAFLALEFMAQGSRRTARSTAFGVDCMNQQGAALASGIYAYQVQAGSLTLTRKILLLQ